LNPTDTVEPTLKLDSISGNGNGSSCAQTKTAGVLLIGADFQALGVARALADQNVPVVLLEPEIGIARFSKFVTRRFAKHDLSSNPDSVKFLLQLAEAESLEGWAIFCVDDETVEFLAKNHEALSQKFIVSVPPWPIARNFYEKNRSTELARRNGIPVPICYPSQSLDQLLAADVVYPVVLKPTFKKNYYDITNDKAVLARDRVSLIREFKAMNRLIDASQIQVQEFLVGGPRNLYSFAAVFDGERIVFGLSANRLRQHPMDFGHSTTYAETRDIPELEELSTRFLKALNYRGVAEVEFMFDERTKTFKFIEMNGRFWGWHALTYNAGLNFPMALLQTLHGIQVERKYAVAGVTWVRMLTDLPTVAGEVFRGQMSPMRSVEVLFRRTPDAVWSWKDPFPFMAEVIFAPYLWWKKGF